MKVGEARGEAKALVKMTLHLIRKEFGPLPSDVEVRVSQMKTGDLEIMIKEILDSKSIEDARRWLQ